MKLYHILPNKLENGKNKDTCGSTFFARIGLISKIKFLVGNSVITEVSELKDIKFTFKIFRMKFLTFITLNPGGRARLIFK